MLFGQAAHQTLRIIDVCLKNDCIDHRPAGGRVDLHAAHPVLIAEPSPSYCWKLVADELGQRRVSTVVLAEVGPPARKVQHSPSVEL